MTNHQMHTKKPNPNSNDLKNRRFQFIAGPFYTSNRIQKKNQLQKKLRGLGYTRKPGSKRLRATQIIARLRA